jgi:hypothetical protein
LNIEGCTTYRPAVYGVVIREFIVRRLRIFAKALDLSQSLYHPAVARTTVAAKRGGNRNAY